jgi:hypothetical protein
MRNVYLRYMRYVYLRIFIFVFGALEQSKQATLADKYEYVMYGKLYKYQEDTTSGQLRVEVYISFGGLLMLLKVSQPLTCTRGCVSLLHHARPRMITRAVKYRSLRSILTGYAPDGIDA